MNRIDYEKLSSSHAKRSIVCDSNEEKPEILRCGRLYLPDYRRIYESTDTACYILKSTKGQYNASMSSVRIIFNHMPILEDLYHILARFRAKYFVILILLLFAECPQLQSYFIYSIAFVNMTKGYAISSMCIIR